jgi:hypothetical protein
VKTDEEWVTRNELTTESASTTGNAVAAYCTNSVARGKFDAVDSVINTARPPAPPHKYIYLAFTHLIAMLIMHNTLVNTEKITLIHRRICWQRQALSFPISVP